MMEAAVGSGSRWKLSVCRGCETRRMMPRNNTSCLFCEERLERERWRKRKPSTEVPFLRLFREARGMTVSELAWVADVDFTTVSRLEARAETTNPQRAQAATAEKLAAALSVEVGELAGCRLRRAA